MSLYKFVGILAFVAAASGMPQFRDENGDPYDPNPVYRYSYQVSDDNAQTYISKEESRDGDDVTGTYSFVNPYGALVTVNYRAGLNGYSEQREVQENFIRIRSNNEAPATVVEPVILNRNTNKAPVTVVNRDAVITKVMKDVVPTVAKVVTSSSKNEENEGDLVAKIIAQLTPFIRQAIDNNLNN